MTLNILHCHSSFDLGGKEARAVRLMNAFGSKARHTVISGVPEALGARAAVAAAIDVRYPERHPSLSGPPTAGRFKALAELIRPFDLVLTYNWGAIDAVMARRLFAKYLPPLVHHEDGFNADEAERLKLDRNLYRRIALSAANAVVVPSMRLETIARRHWGLSARRLHRIGNGIDTRAYAGRPTTAIPGLHKKGSSFVVGTLAGLRPVKNLPRLVCAVAALSNAQLVIVGEGPERATIIEAANACGMFDRLVLPGFMPDPHRYIGHFDIFALSSDSEQAPIALIEAMAAGLPVAALDVGDVRSMVAEDNLPFIVKDEASLAAALVTLAGQPALRAKLGEANRAKAQRDYDEKAMIAAYAQLYERMVGKPHALRDT